ncbi:hypothetical protein N7507_004042 [Penicillium longicatenatum]|nr:hypothetical protein N7507_004042 [Penicillium longicatenatum]
MHDPGVFHYRFAHWKYQKDAPSAEIGASNQAVDSGIMSASSLLFDIYAPYNHQPDDLPQT